MPNPLKWRIKLGASATRLFRYIRRRLVALKLVIQTPPETDHSMMASESAAGVNIPGKWKENNEKNAPLHDSRLILKTYSDMPGISFYDLRVWRKVTESLPDDYVLPNPESMRMLLPMTADFYRSLFLISSARPDLIVDDHIWKRIKAALPSNYKIPDSF
ncbi:hypothetical protein [Cohnella terricola]|uniref:Uncharacterized protein n=1 Tax=Cohnella terricola TaxID=1289167 RepID=A0A559JQK2_9BACL|nr:hypothetical protein [Cohnella terricola]TVY02159.1 hypothetical protein FPZ45_06875 [Cohnella terricola]